MTAAEITTDTAAVLRESIATADYARNAAARQVAAWTLTHHPDLPIAEHWRRLEDQYVSLHRAYIGVKSKNGVTA